MTKHAKENGKLFAPTTSASTEDVNAVILRLAELGSERHEQLTLLEISKICYAPLSHLVKAGIV